MFKKKCPRCGNSNINVIKESFADDLRRNMLNVLLPFRFLTSRGKKPKNLNVCTSKECGFSWEDRK